MFNTVTEVQLYCIMVAFSSIGLIVALVTYGLAINDIVQENKTVRYALLAVALFACVGSTVPEFFVTKKPSNLSVKTVRVSKK